MKDKALVFIAGLLIGAILTTGVFMIINKNSPNLANNNRQFNNGNGPRFNGGEPPTREQLDAMERTVLEDGTVQYRSPDGGVMMQRRGGPGGEGPGTSSGIVMLP